MTRLRVPVLLVLFGAACSFSVPPEGDYFDGEGGGGFGGASGGNTNGGNANGGKANGGSGAAPTAGSGAVSGGGDAGEAGAMSGGTGGRAGGNGGGGASGSSGGVAGGGVGGVSGEPGVSGGAGGVGGVAGAAGSAGADCGLPLTKSSNEPCGACNTGTRTRSFTLNEACAYVETGLTECSGVTAACTPGQTIACANGDSCGHRVCSDTCTYGACVPKVAGGCLRIREGHTDEGSNYQCCGSQGHWQFCLSSCQWSTACAACSQGSPDYCTECY